MSYSNAVVSSSFRTVLPVHHSQTKTDGELNPSDTDIQLEEHFESMIKNETKANYHKLLRFIDLEIAKLLLEAPISD